MIRVRMKCGFAFGNLTLIPGEEYLLNEWQASALEKGAYDIITSKGKTIDQIKNILVLKSNGLGNVINIGPLLKRLKQINKDFQIDLCTLPLWTSIFKNHVRHIYSSEEIKGMSKIQKHQWDLIINALPASFDTEELGLPAVNIISTSSEAIIKQHEVDACLEIVNGYFGVPSNHIKTFADFKETKVTDKAYFVCAPGYSKTLDYYKMKGYKYWAEVCNKIKSQTGLGCVVCGVEGEMIDGEYIDATGKFDVLETGGILKNARFVIGNDTGLGHYASALGVRTYTIFGPTSWVKNRPYNNGVIIKRGLKCQPCQFTSDWRKCEHLECMNIDPELVAKEIIKKETIKKSELSICFATAGRYEMLVQTMNSIAGIEQIELCQVVIVDDGADERSRDLIDKAKTDFPCRVEVVTVSEKRGKERYNESLNDMVHASLNCKYIMFSADDVILNSGIVKTILDNVHRFKDNKALHFFRDGREDLNGSAYTPTEDHGEFNDARTNDGFLSVYEVEFLSGFKFEAKADERGSGSWFCLNKYMRDNGYKQLRYKKSLGEHIGNIWSVMNDTWRKEHPITGKEVTLYETI